MTFCFAIHNLLLIKTSSFEPQNITFCIVKHHLFVKPSVLYSYSYIKHYIAQYFL